MISSRGVQPDPQKIKALINMPPPNNKKELQAFLGIVNYLGKFSSGTAEVCDLLQKLTSSKVTWTWNASYQSLFIKAKLLIKSEMCMKFYDDTKPLYLKTDASGVGLGATLLQTQEGTTCQKDMVPDNTIMHPIVFASKSLTDAEHGYSNIEREALGILYGLKIFHHYCFVREVYVITDHKPLLSIFKKDMASCHNEYSESCSNSSTQVQILYKPGPEIFIAHCLPMIITKKTKMSQSKAWT